MKSPVHVIVLAAGKGKRMRSAMPKVLLPVAGRAMLAHVLDTARSLQPEAVHVVHGHGGERLREQFAADDIQWVEQAEQRGTGHAVQLAMAQIPDNARVLVLYGDMPLVRHDSLAALLASERSLAMLAADHADPSGYGRVIRDPDGNVRAIVEEADASAEQRAVRLGNTGLVAAHAAPLRHWVQRLDNANTQGEYYLTDVFAFAADAGEPAACHVLADTGEAAGANDPWQLTQLEGVFRQRRARELAAAGVRMADPARIDVRGTVEVGRDVVLDADVILEGHVRLGDGVRVGPFCRVADSDIGADTAIAAHCDLDGVQTGQACSIGPFARMRPRTELADAAHIGNFVETKKTRLGAGSKANHLTYLGDADIGAEVNVGAGTITCNYDGTNKHRTSIGDTAFIGSQTALVAPVSVGAGATIGAGSVITRDAPADTLSVSRARQKEVSGWKRPGHKHDDAAS